MAEQRRSRLRRTGYDTQLNQTPKWMRTGVVTMPDELGHVYDRIARRLLRGMVVPVLGAGVNLWRRPPPPFKRGVCLPSGQELADELTQFLGDVEIDGRDLARVSQYVVALEGHGPLENELREVFNAACPPNDLHFLLARLSRCIRETEGSHECMLIVTTNYDDSLERAFIADGEPYELITYIARGEHRGKFRHVTADNQVIYTPNEYADPRLGQRTVIAKIHGSVDRARGAGSFVITEDHYIDYIARSHGDVARLFPAKLAAKLRNSYFLFLGYSLRDWNLRVMLYRLKEEQDGRDFKSWAIQKDPDLIDQAAWDERGVKILPVSAEDFVTALEERLPAQCDEHRLPASA